MNTTTENHGDHLAMTSERPTKEGRYWYRGRLRGQRGEWIVSVWEQKGVCYLRGLKGEPVKVADVRGEWNGPERWTPGYPCQHNCEITFMDKASNQQKIQCLKCCRVRDAESSA